MGGEGAGRVSAGNLGAGGGLNIFFRGRNPHQASEESRTEIHPKAMPNALADFHSFEGSRAKTKPVPNPGTYQSPTMVL